MDSSNKWKTDFNTGKNRRIEVVKNLNLCLGKPVSGLQIIRVHEFLKTMKIHEKVKNNTLINRKHQSNFLQAMGLDYLVIGEEGEFPLMIRFSDDPGFYIKVPSDYCTSPGRVKQFLKKIGHYYVLFVLKKGDKIYERYCGPMELRNITALRRYHLSETKGNRNRLQFDYNPSKLVYQAPKEITMFSKNLIERIKDIYNENIHGNMDVRTFARKSINQGW